MRRFLPLIFLLALVTTAFSQQRGASITVIAPTFGATGTTVSIRGAGFSGFETGSPWVKELASEPPPGAVEFNGVLGEILFWQDDLITVKVPKGASTGAIRIILPQARAALTGDVFEVYYSTRGETRAEPSELARPERYRALDEDRRNESSERQPFFDEQTLPPIPYYANPWFSSLTPGERTFLSEHGAEEMFFFGNPFSLGRRGSFSFSNGLFSRPDGFDRRGFGPSRQDLFFRDFFFKSSHNTGVPFWFFFNGKGHSSFRNEGHTFRR